MDGRYANARGDAVRRRGRQGKGAQLDLGVRDELEVDGLPFGSSGTVAGGTGAGPAARVEAGLGGRLVSSLARTKGGVAGRTDSEHDRAWAWSLASEANSWATPAS